MTSGVRLAAGAFETVGVRDNNDENPRTEQATGPTCRHSTRGTNRQPPSKTLAYRSSDIKLESKIWNGGCIART